jgi:hypothetical protein
MAATGEEKVFSELKACRESLGQVRTELGKSLGQLETYVTGLRDSLAHAQENYRGVQTLLEQVQQNSTAFDAQLQAARVLDARLSQMESTLASVAVGSVTAGAQADTSGVACIKQALPEIAAGVGQEGILDAFLDQVGRVVNRAIVFTEKNGRFEAWRSKGFPANALASLVVDDPKDPIMAVATTRQMVYREQAPADARPSLGDAGQLPHAFVAIPLVFDEYVPVILYADSDGSIDADYLEALSYLTALVLKNNSLQQLSAGQPAAAPVVPAPEPAKKAAPAPPPPPVRVAAPAPPPPVRAVEPTPPPRPVKPVEPAPPPPPVKPVEPLTFDLVEEEPAPQTTAAEDWEIPESMREERAPAPIKVVATPAARPQPAAPAPPPAPAAPVAAAPPVPDLSTEEAEKYNNEARRFARLLVSEIKLYNEDEVYNGRQNSDLYLRLKRDVDRSRDMYEKRVHPAIAKSTDHFHEELIRILAREDASLMGPAYPGPMLRR